MKLRYYVCLVPIFISLCSVWISACGSKKNPTTPQNISPTATPNPYTGPTYSLSGAVTYTGTYTSGKPIYVLLTTNPLFNSSAYAAVTLTSANGTYSFTDLAPGTYYLGAVYDATDSWNPFSNSPPPPGDYYYIYGGASGGCVIDATQGVTVSGNTTGPALTFGNTCSFSAANSLSGTVTYNGGTTGGTLIVDLFTNANILEGSPVTSVSMATTTGAYSFSGLVTGNYYLAAIYNTGVATHYVPINGYYDIYGGGSGGCSLVSTTPVFVGGATTGPALTFGNSCAYYSTGSLSGAITYNGSGTVSASNKIWVMLFNTSQLVGNGPVAYASFTSAIGAYNFTNLGVGPYYLVAIYDSIGTWAGPGGAPPPSGESYEVYGGGNGGCDQDPTAVIVNGTTTGPALVFGDSCKWNTSLTLSGSVSYTGGDTVNAGHPVYTLLFNSPNIGPGGNSQLLAAVTLTSASGSYSFPVTSGTYYLVSVFDEAGGWGLVGEPPNGDIYTAYGAADDGCDLNSSLSPVYVTGNTTGPTLSYGNSCVVENFSLSGSVSLLAADGTPAPGTPFYVFAFTNPYQPFSSVYPGAVTAMTSMTSSGSYYTANYGFSVLPAGSYYIGAFFDSADGTSYSGGSSLSVPTGEYLIYYDGTSDGGACSATATVNITTANVTAPNGLTVGTACTTP